MLGIVLSIGWQLAAAPPIPGATQSGMTKIIPIVVIVIGLFLLWYSWNAEKKGVLR
jgi:membrane protein DedA with SNARE-associated domain